MKNLAKYNSQTPAVNWSNFIDNFFNHSLSNVIGSDMAHSQPAVNIVESTNSFRIELAAPGLEKMDFNIQVEKDSLHIEAKKEASKTVEDSKFTRREFNYTTFRRSFQLPHTVQKESIHAKYEDGILNIHLSKTAEAEARTKTIEVA